MGNVGQVEKQRLENDVHSLQGKVSRVDQELCRERRQSRSDLHDERQRQKRDVREIEAGRPGSVCTA